MANLGTLSNCSWNAKYPFEPNAEYIDYFPNLSKVSDIDPIMAAADFYLLFGLVSQSIVNFPKVKHQHQKDVVNAAIKLGLSLEELMLRNEAYRETQINSPTKRLNDIAEDAGKEFDNLLTNIDSVFMDYVNAACGGELRHHQATLCLGPSSGTDSRYRAWRNWGFIFNSEGPECLTEMQAIFLDFNSGSYGGPPWAAAAKLLYERIHLQLASSYRENQIVFVDRVFNLQHNTGCFLNKLEWTNKRQGREGAEENFRNMADTVLVAHSSNPPDLTMLYERASLDVRRMVKTTIDLAMEKNLSINGEWS